jgi:2-dehydro-3-deoxygalactonokinase
MTNTRLSPDDRDAANWIAADWGTSNLRVWVLDGAGTVLAERSSDRGMGQLRPAEFEPALLDLIADFLPPGRVTPVLICGMAGARQGWAEAPYSAVPCPPAGTLSVAAPAADPRLSVRILPGLSQAAPPDVMRGEETQIAGFLARAPDFDGTLCLPGTHTKWVRVQAGQVQAFRTVMTGELFALLSGQSVLRHSVAEGWDEPAFADAVAAAARNPETFAADLFSIRAAALLSGQTQAVGRARLSGVLIGAELAATRAFWQDRAVVLIGAPALCGHYAAALARLGASATPAAAAALTLEGLKAAHASLNREPT